MSLINLIGSGWIRAALHVNTMSQIYVLVLDQIM